MSVKPDREIKEAVLQTMREDPLVAATGLSVVVERGKVTLTGTVGDYATWLRAVEATRRVDGVWAVVDNIQVALINGGEGERPALLRLL